MSQADNDKGLDCHDSYPLAMRIYAQGKHQEIEYLT